MNEQELHNEESIALQSGGLAMFAALVIQISSSTKTNDKLDALAEYFTLADDKDKVWVIAIFSGRRPKRIVSSTLLAEWCTALANIPSWLFLESYSTVGDLGETIALLLPDPVIKDGRGESLSYYLKKFIEIEKQDELVRKQFIIDSWQQMNHAERFVFNKLITGSFRIGVSQKIIVNALTKVVSLSSSVIAHRISGNWDPSTISFNNMLGDEVVDVDHSKPYPFYLAYALEDEPSSLGDPSEWQAEWKWDGIRGQMIKRNNELFVWSRGEELMTEKFPEYIILKDLLPDGIVLDGEIIPAENGKPLPFAALQTRIGRKNITKKQLTEAPISFFVYDLLEYNYEDWRERSLEERRNKMEEILQKINNNSIQLPPVIKFTQWDDLAELRKTSREMNSEGIMLKRKNSIYQVGRKRGDWWKWKIDALTIDCVMIYAQKGAGRRSNLYTAYTFAVKDGDQLIPFTRAYSGLTDKEFAQVDNFVKRNSLEKFGPVRTVKPELVFEIAFEGIAASNRHKSGVALRFPRMSRWRKDKKVDEINTLDDLKAMLNMYGK
ncbi:MAG: ATP-dependent ligase LigC [Chitinophagaceae bacterium]|nr:ATP-dependent ligase LigC [Chitinophagaceae bacterium]